MSSLAEPLVTWTEFLRLPERPDAGTRYELHDGEVVVVPPARPRHIKLQKRIERLLEALAGERGVVTIEFPYRPGPNLQYWVADVAYIPQDEWDSMPANEHPVYSPAIIVEVLSPSNTPAKISRQRIVAMSAGTDEFWVVDAERQCVHVTSVRGVSEYGPDERIEIPLFGASLAVADLLAP